MSNESETVQVVFNGEIYNFRELRQRLLRKGHVFRSETDTEVLVHGYEEWGERLPEHLEGMFAFAIWDVAAERLLLARDRFGEKPLFVRRDADRFWFSSSLRALVNEISAPVTVRAEALNAYLRHGFVPSDQCIYNEIDRISPAHAMSIDVHGTKIWAYWDLEPSQEAGRGDCTASDALAEVETRLAKIVNDRLTSDVPVGVFLSGGVDSTVIAAICSQIAPGMTAFHVRIPGNDESAYAKHVAKQLGVQLVIDEIPPASWELVTEVHGLFGEPFADPAGITNYRVAQLARQHVTVILSGDGGDELFGGGYGMTSRERRYERLRRYVPRPVRRSITRVCEPWSPMRRPAEVLKRADMTLGERYDERLDLLRRCRVMPFSERISSELSKSVAEKRRESLLDRMQSGGDAVRRIMWADTTYRLAGQFLVKVDVTSMAHSLEVRCPFLDSGLAQWLFSINPQFLANARDSKILLKKLANRFVDTASIWRPKQGFEFSVRSALRGDWRQPALRVVSERRDELECYLDREFLGRLFGASWDNNADAELMWRVVCLVHWMNATTRLVHH